MIKVVAKFEVESDKVDEFKQIASELIDKTRLEEGNISYELYQNNKNEQILTFIEEWKNQKALEAHMETNHLKTVLPKFQKISTTEPEINTYTKVK